MSSFLWWALRVCFKPIKLPFQDLHKICTNPIFSHNYKSRTHRRFTLPPHTPKPDNRPPHPHEGKPLCALSSSTTSALPVPFCLYIISFFLRHAWQRSLRYLPQICFSYYIVLISHHRYHILPAALRMGPSHTHRLIPRLCPSFFDTYR